MENRNPEVLRVVTSLIFKIGVRLNDLSYGELGAKLNGLRIPAGCHKEAFGVNDEGGVDGPLIILYDGYVTVKVNFDDKQLSCGQPKSGTWEESLVHRLQFIWYRSENEQEGAVVSIPFEKLTKLRGVTYDTRDREMMWNYLQSNIHACA